jgi:hypothetical protein
MQHAQHPDDEEVGKAFRRFVKSVKAADFSAFKKLHHKDVRPDLDEAWFAKNADRAKSHRFSFKLRSITYEGEVAEVSFEVIPGDGDETHHDEAVLTFVKENDRFFIVES